MIMRNVTRVFLNYRESVRNIWNKHYVPVIEEHGGSFELEETFCRIEIEMFDALVAIPLDDGISKLESHMSDPKKGLSLYHVVPSSDNGVPVMISREKNKTQYWDYPKDRLLPDEVEMRFVRFYDFSSDDYSDFKYVMTQIIGSQIFPDLVGRLALIDMQYAKILKAEPINSADAKGRAAD
ncbi:hypothetical protein JCM12296A_60600 [Desulfosarcina cetonica]